MRVALKLLLVMASLVVLVLGVEAVLRSRSDASLYEQDLRRDQRILGRALREAAELTWREQSLAAAQRLVAAAAAGEVEVEVHVVDATSGRVREQLTSHLGIPDVRADSPWDLVQYIEGDTLRTVVPLAGPRQGLALELSTPLTSGREALALDMRRFGYTALLLLLATSVLGVTAGAWIVSRPIDRLVRQTRSLAAGEFVHSTLAQRDEIGELGRALDRTSDRLAEARQELERETEQLLEAQDKLRQADRLATVGTLAAGVAHELGTPLHVITRRAQRIRRAGTDPDTAKHEADVIVEQCGVVQTIVRGLLDFARSPIRDRGELELDAILERTIRMVEPLLRNKKAEVELVASASASGPALVLGNAGQLQQVFTNLLVNAAQAMPSGGPIRVWIERLRPGRSEPERRFAVVHVLDHGAGIDATTLDHIYDPFFTTKQPGEGTGLGLSIAYGIVRDHGGELEVHSEPGRGAEFCVWLPEVEA